MKAAAALAVMALTTTAAQADSILSAAESAAWLQRIADASRQLAYEGVFVFSQGERIQTLQVANRPSGQGKESRLVILDGQPREVRCQDSESIRLTSEGNVTQLEQRSGTRHFPDLLPANANALAEWYNLRLGGMDRVGGHDCQRIDLLPKDRYRWGYQLCVEKKTALPLKAVMVNEAGQPMLHYAFAEVRIGTAPRPAPVPAARIAATSSLRPTSGEIVEVRQLPPGFERVAAMRRALPNQAGEVEHWVFSDGLTHVSLFLKQNERPVNAVKGNSARGMMHLLTRQVGKYQATVVGDAPWPTVERIAAGLAER